MNIQQLLAIDRARGGGLLTTRGMSSLILDTLDTAGAYSLRKLRTDYTGSTIRVRRSSDNAEQDIGFVSNELDVNTLLSFVGGENLLTRSEEFETGWGRVALNVTSNTQLSPINTMTADVLVPDTSNGAHTIENGPVLGIQTFSCFLKAGGYDFVQLADNSGANSDFCNFNLATGVVASSQGYVGTITPADNGFYRCSVTRNFATGQNIRIQPLPSDIAARRPGYIGDGVSGVIAWGGQINNGSTPKPYQPTTATALLGNGHVVTLYDQSGNNRNATQATASAQPLIVSGGVLVTDGGKPAISANGSNRLVTPAFTANLDNISIFSVQNASPTAESYELPWAVQYGANFNIYFRRNITTGGMQSGTITPGMTVATTGTEFNKRSQNSVIVNRSIANLKVYTEGVISGTSSTASQLIGSQANYQIYIMGANTHLTGTFQELIVFNFVIDDATRQALEANQMAYYSIT
jgi:hypothetical protein